MQALGSDAEDFDEVVETIAHDQSYAQEGRTAWQSNQNAKMYCYISTLHIHY